MVNRWKSNQPERIVKRATEKKGKTRRAGSDAEESDEGSQKKTKEGGESSLKKKNHTATNSQEKRSNKESSEQRNNDARIDGTLIAKNAVVAGSKKTKKMVKSAPTSSKQQAISSFFTKKTVDGPKALQPSQASQPLLRRVEDVQTSLEKDAGEADGTSESKEGLGMLDRTDQTMLHRAGQGVSWGRWSKCPRLRGGKRAHAAKEKTP
jgi:hypothetical protein